MPVTIAIDGPAGAGKSTVARRVALELDLTYIDTGAMYRAIAWKAVQQGIGADDAEALAGLAASIRLTFSSVSPAGEQKVFIEGRDVTSEIRLPEISNRTSEISALPALRRVVVAQQQELGRSAERGVVLEGRDIGSVVFPDAEVKIFLTASPEERARRRVSELTARGLNATYEEVLADQKARDLRDSRRVDSPLLAADDAIVLDTDTMTISEVVARILLVCTSKTQLRVTADRFESQNKRSAV